MIQKRYIVISIVALIAVSLLGWVMYFLKEHQNVTFKISYANASVVISETQDRAQKFATLQNNSSLWLNRKTYFVFFENSELSHEAVPVKIEGSTSTITLDPSFSEEKLKDMLKTEQKTISTKLEQSITATTPYTPDAGKLYHQGEWYATSIPIYKDSSSDPEIGNPDDVDIYYVVLKKEGTSWKLAAKPTLILTKPDNPNIPDYIIKALNPLQAR